MQEENAGERVEDVRGREGERETAEKRSYGVVTRDG